MVGAWWRPRQSSLELEVGAEPVRFGRGLTGGARYVCEVNSFWTT